MSPGTETARENHPPPLRGAIAFALIFAVGLGSYALPRIGARLPLPVLPAGVAAGLVYRWGRRLWPAVLLASLALDLSLDRPFAGALAAAVGLTAAAALTVWMLDRAGFDRRFVRARDVGIFLLAASVGMSVAASFGMLGFWLGGDRWEAPTVLKWIRWWSNTTAGVLLVGPLIVALDRESLEKLLAQRIAGALWILAVALCCASILLMAEPLVRPLRVMFGLLVIVIGAFRFGLVPTAFAALSMVATAAYSFAFGRGAFASFAPIQGLVMMWVTSAALTGLTLITTALLAERDSAALARLRAEHRYAQIFETNPQPLWVHDAGSGAFLLVNEAALRQYGWSREEFGALRVAELGVPDAPPPLPEPEQGAERGDPAPAPYETRHRRRDRRVIDVEVWSRPIELDGRRAVLVYANDVTERRALGSALIEAVAGEQRRIGQEMHDGLGQELTGLALSAQALATRAERDRLSIADDLRQVASLAAACIAGARRIVQGLAPLSDADGSLEAALEALARRMSIGNVTVRFRSWIDGALDLKLDVRNHLYRIAQEAVQNALKHSAAATVAIELHSDRHGLRLEIDDDGRGISVDHDRSVGLGMRTMRFRASSIGARLRIDPRPGGGTRVSCELRRTPLTVGSAQ